MHVASRHVGRYVKVTGKSERLYVLVGDVGGYFYIDIGIVGAVAGDVFVVQLHHFLFKELGHFNLPLGHREFVGVLRNVGLGIDFYIIDKAFQHFVGSRNRCRKCRTCKCEQGGGNDCGNFHSSICFGLLQI